MTDNNTTCTTRIKATVSSIATNAAATTIKQPFYLSPSPTSNNEENNHLFINEYPSIQEFNHIIQDYLQNLSSKKRDKALVDNHRYSLILQVLKDPKNTTISTAQFRFWVKKMFRLSCSSLTTNRRLEFVCHDGKPVATREKIYNILIIAHKEAHHGGRDKTSALVRKRYSWIPKELIARFVRICPFCISRRSGGNGSGGGGSNSCHLTAESTSTLTSTSLLNFLTSSPPPQQHSPPPYITRKRKSHDQMGRSNLPTPSPHWYTSNLSLVANVATSAAAAAIASSNSNSSNNSSSSSSPLTAMDLDFYYSQPNNNIECGQQQQSPTRLSKPFPTHSNNSNDIRLPSYSYLLFSSTNQHHHDSSSDATSAPSVAAAAVVAAAAMVASNNHLSHQLNSSTPASGCGSPMTVKEEQEQQNIYPSQTKVVDDTITQEMDHVDEAYVFDDYEQEDIKEKNEAESTTTTTTTTTTVILKEEQEEEEQEKEEGDTLCSKYTTAAAHAAATSATTILSLLNIN